MIELRTTRHYTEAVRNHFFPYINLFKQTRLNNLAYKSLASEEYLSAIVINCLLKEIEDLLIRKLVTTKGYKLTFKFTPAQGVVLYKTLLALPIPSNQEYLNVIRSEWLQLIDQELIKQNLYQRTTSKVHTDI
ncbi:MAG: hypothetical protein ACJ748_01635 [Flavisolibacter sp.]